MIHAGYGAADLCVKREKQYYSQTFNSWNYHFYIISMSILKLLFVCGSESLSCIMILSHLIVLLRFPPVVLELPLHSFPYFSPIFQPWVALGCGAASYLSGFAEGRMCTREPTDQDRSFPLTPAVQTPMCSGGGSLKIEGLGSKVRRRMVGHSSISQTLCSSSRLSSAQVPGQSFNIWLAWTVTGDFKMFFVF